MTQRRFALIAVLAAAPLGCAGAQALPPSSASPATPTSPSPRTGAAPSAAAAPDAGALPAWVERDAATRTVTLALDVTPKDAAGSARIAGQRGGALTVVVPKDWTVRWRWTNADSSAAHSLVVMPEREKVPLQGGAPAFPNALTRQVLDGLPVGSRDRASFTADEGGWYWVLCGVPGHAAEGEWFGLRIDPRAADVSVRSRGAP